MYKLLLVTDREEVRNAFLSIDDWETMDFEPIAIKEDVQEAIACLETNCIDAVGYSIRHSDVSPLHHYLVDVRPSLPIFQTHKHDVTLRQELERIRRFLAQLRSDFTDNYDEQAVLEYLRDELMHQLLSLEIHHADELKSRLKLARSRISPDKPAFLFDFDMPQGEVYLSDRWHYGRERLENALLSNFFGRYIDDVYYGVAVLTPRHIRLIGCQRSDSPDEDPAQVAQRVQAHVFRVMEHIKQYLDLDLHIEQFTALENLYPLVEREQDV